jgi:hypothetical protein
VIGVACTIVLTATTLLVNVPINSEIINVWSVNDPPADWAQVRDLWNLFHAIRTVLAVVALLCLLLAAMMPQPQQDTQQVKQLPRMRLLLRACVSKAMRKDRGC